MNHAFNVCKINSYIPSRQDRASKNLPESQQSKCLRQDSGYLPTLSGICCMYVAQRQFNAQNEIAQHRVSTINTVSLILVWRPRLFRYRMNFQYIRTQGCHPRRKAWVTEFPGLVRPDFIPRPPSLPPVVEPGVVLVLLLVILKFLLEFVSYLEIVTRDPRAIALLSSNLLSSFLVAYSFHSQKVCYIWKIF